MVILHIKAYLLLILNKNYDGTVNDYVSYGRPHVF